MAMAQEPAVLNPNVGDLGEWEPDIGTDWILHSISAKQDRLEARLDAWQAEILKNFQDLRKLDNATVHGSRLPDLEDDSTDVPKLVLASKVTAENISSTPRQPTSIVTVDSPSCWHRQTTADSEFKSQSRSSIETTTRRDSNKSAFFFDAMEEVSKKLGTIYADKVNNRRLNPSWRKLSNVERARLDRATQILGDNSSSRSIPSQVIVAARRPSDESCDREGGYATQSWSAKVLFGMRKMVSTKKTRMTRTFTSDINDTAFLVRLVHAPWFFTLCGSMVIANSALIGITVEFDANDMDSGADVLEVLSHACGAFFIVELLLRILAFGVQHFFWSHEDRFMNLFDAVLVFLSVVDTVLSVFNTKQSAEFDLGQAFKTLKLLRILRIFKIFRFFHELSLMVLMILECLTSLFWAIVLLLIIMYTFAVIFTQNATTYRRKQDDDALGNLVNVEKMFGTLTRTFYYLFQSILGGINWGVVSDVMVQFDTFSTVFFFFYIVFTALAVLNIITGIFVDNALETSRTQRDFIIAREEKAKTQTMRLLGKLFDEMDEDGSGQISWEEMESALQNHHTSKYFAALGVQGEDMRQLFDMMDYDGSGLVDLEEFLDGCQRCTGDAKSIDIHAILHEVKRVNKRLEEGDEWMSKTISSEIRNLKMVGVSLKNLVEMSASLKKVFDNARQPEEPYDLSASESWRGPPPPTKSMRVSLTEAKDHARQPKIQFEPMDRERQPIVQFDLTASQALRELGPPTSRELGPPALRELGPPIDCITESKWA